ncbi:ABC transporter permease [Alicyclobacillus sp. SO9]|nr:ABC transporter permease [Alicyclobacillus sp. SO9]
MNSTDSSASTPAGANEKRKSSAYLAFLKRRRRHVLLVRMTQLFLLIAFLAVWELAARMHWVNSMLTSRPTQIASMFGQLLREGKVLSDTWITTKETLIGFVISMGIGGVSAVVLWWSVFAAKVADPYLVVLNALPKVALGPIFFIWLGDRMSIYGMAIAISLIVTIMMLVSGFHEIDKGKIKLMKSFGATRWQILKIVVLPASIPNFVATTKVNIGLTLVGVIMGEFLSAKAGLGFLIIYGGQVFQMGLVMTSICILAVLSLLMYGVVTYIGRLLMKRYNFD